MKKELQYTVCCQLTLAEFELGQIVETRQIHHQLATDSTELNEVFADLYDQFRSPDLLGLQIVSIEPSHQHTPEPVWEVRA